MKGWGRRSVVLYAVLVWSDLAMPEALGPFAANGLQFAVEQWQGQGAALQLERLRKNFPGTVRRRGEWQQVQRIHDGVSEVLQWRGEQQHLWVLLSRLDLRRPPAPTRGPSWILPRGCRQLQHLVSADGDMQVVQRRLACSQRSEAAIRALSSAAVAQGWRTAASTVDRLVLQRGSDILSLQAMPPSDVLWLQRGPGSKP